MAADPAQPDPAFDLPARPAQKISRKPYVWAVLLITTLVFTLAIFSSWQEKQLYHERSELSTQNMARLMERNIRSEFDKVDVVLQSVALHYQEQMRQGRPATTSINDYLAGQESLIPEVISLRITDQHGVIRFGKDTAGRPPVALGDRDYFTRQRDDPTLGLILSGPVFARVSQQWTIVLSRRINAPDGSFAGVVYAMFSTTHFGKILSSIELGPAGAASLRMSDFTLIHRYPASNNPVGSQEISREGLAAIKAHPEAGHFIAASALDGIERSNAYRRISPYPLLLIVGMAPEDFMSAWRGNTLQLLGLAALTTLIALLAAILHFRLSQRQAADLQKRQAAEDIARATAYQLESALQWSNTGAWDIDLESLKMHRSLMHDHIFGYESLQPQWTYETFLAHVIPEDRAKVDRLFHEAVGALLDWTSECRIQRTDGKTRWILIAGGLQPNAKGQAPHLTGIVRDITERKIFETDEEIRLKIFEQLAQGGELDDILALVANYIEHDRPEHLCSIMLIDAESGCLRPSVAPRLPADFLAAIDHVAVCEGGSACGTAACRRTAVIVEDIGSHPLGALYKSPAQAAGLCACWSQPIIGTTGQALGTIAIYQRQAGAPGETDLKLLSRASYLAAVAIERTQMKLALAASERVYHTLADNIPDNITRYDMQGRKTYINPAMCRVLGIEDQTSHLGKTPSESFPPHIIPAIELDRILHRVISTGQPEGTEMTIGAGARRGEIYNVRYVAERDESGNIVGALAIGRDITELRSKTRQLEESLGMLRTLAARRSSAREEERKHIAREIHDELGQTLTALRLEIATLKIQFGKGNQILSERCLHLMNITDRTIQVVRKIATALRPAALDMGITSALRWLAADFKGRTQLACHLHMDMDGICLDEDQSLAVFRIVQESLTNIARHSEARQVKIALESCTDRYHLSIRDDGKGFDPESVRTKSFGLVGIRERALLMGGEVHFISSPGLGTAIEISIPHHQTDWSMQ